MEYKTEAIYFVSFTDGKRFQSDRREYIKDNPSLEGFHKWIEDEREKIEAKIGEGVTILNINYIEKYKQ